MLKATFMYALNFARFAGAAVVELCGGEPLLYRELEWSVECARADGFELILRTNGYLLHQRRGFIAKNFQAVGISLDGDAKGNDQLRPLKKGGHMSAETKFEIPIQEIVALKALNPKLFVVLASVATSENVASTLALSRLLVQRKLPIDLWKIYQFTANNFRAKVNDDRFKLTDEVFESLRRDIEVQVAGEIPTSCRRSHETDGSCLVINRDGDVVLGSRRFGSVVCDNFGDICSRLQAVDAGPRILRNKAATYPTVIEQRENR